MTSEIRKFTKRYSPTAKVPTAWLRKFWSNTMYKSYYSYLDRQFMKYNHNYTRAVAKDVRKYSSYRQIRAMHPSSRRAA